MNETVRKLAEATGWTIPEGRVQELAMIYNATMDDTRAVLEADISQFSPATVFEAE
jgi:hypothetical protein